jgi:NitT/TauT family transport system substrate-binding protein
MKKFAKAMLAIALLGQCCATAALADELPELRIPKGAGGIPFLPLMVMERQKLIEQHAAQLGHKTLKVSYVSLGGAAVTIDALLSGATHIHVAGPPSFLLLWDRTRGRGDVMGIAAMSSIPAYLNTTNPNIKALRDVTDKDKIALNAVKISIPAIIMQMAARKEFGPAETFRYDKYTVSMTHPDGVAALLSGISEVNMHFTSVSFHMREIKDPRVRTIMSTDDVMGGSTTFTMLSATRKFREDNPITYKALLLGLKDAVEFINKDKKAAAQIYLDTLGGRGETLEEAVASLDDPRNVITMVPQNTLKYAQFMNEIGSLKNRAESWKDLFFPEVHDLPGS